MLHVFLLGIELIFRIQHETVVISTLPCLNMQSAYIYFFDETLIFLNVFLELQTQLGINMWNNFWVLYFFLMIYSAGFMQYRFVLIDSIL